MSKILVVDNEEEVRKLIVSTFRNSGHYIIEATNGDEGIQRAIADKPDIIISDVCMPHTDGMEFAKVISTHPGTSKIPIILMSAQRLTAEDLRAGLSNGAREYFTKPFAISDLMNSVEKLLRDAEMRRDIPWK